MDPFVYRTNSTPVICKALKSIHPPKMSTRPDGMDDYLVKLAADFNPELINYIFSHLSLQTNVVTKIWKAACVLLLFKTGHLLDVNNYCQ